MFTKVQPFLLHALSSVHAGSGNEIGLVDTPIQRETHTGYPKIESSSLKGAIRATVEEYIAASEEFNERDHIYKVFGNPPKEKKEEDLQSGAIALADARLLLFPIKSMRGIFAFATCPNIIERYNHEINSYVKGSQSLPVPSPGTVSSEKITAGSKSSVVLEEYTFNVTKSDETLSLAEALESSLFPEQPGFLTSRLIVLSDDDFADFVRLSTEVNARIRINPEKGTVDEGALFYEENVPPETVFYSYLFVGKVRVEKPGNDEMSPEDILALFKNEEYFPNVFQLGGNSTLGRGMLKQTMLNEEGN